MEIAPNNCMVCPRTAAPCGNTGQSAFTALMANPVHMDVTRADSRRNVIVTAARVSCPILADVPGPHPADSRRGACAAALGVWLIGSLGCIREPLPDICPSVEVGELVISELRGPQEGDDSFGHYIEVYNAAGKTIDLQGLVVFVIQSDGETVAFLVRDAIELAPEAYAVLGPGLPDDRPNWIDYGVGWDISGGNPDEGEYPTDLLRYRGGFVALTACDEPIDGVFYETDSLPTLGTLACGNAENPPSADANDDSLSGCWCTDAQEIGSQPLFGIGLPGSPGGPNRCP
jgi:hypothetical protein